MLAVWGRRYEEYIEWVQQWIKGYEKRSETKLPALTGRYEGEGIKRSAMVQFLGDLTLFAALEDELFDFGDIKARFDARHYNGRIRQAGFTKKKSRYHIYVPGYNRIKQLRGKEVVERELPFAPAGYPSEFAKDALAYIKSWR